MHRVEYEQIVKELCYEGTITRNITLCGPGGFGKTALAQAACHDERVRARYPDGILWTTLGKDLTATDLISRIRDLIRWWAASEPPAFETAHAAAFHLRTLLRDRRALLVIDDLWTTEDIRPFPGLEPGSAQLWTTRHLLGALPSATINVGPMELREAVELLGAGLPRKRRSLGDLAQHLSGWPLLLKLVNRQLLTLLQDGLNDEEALQVILDTLREEGPTAFDIAGEERALSISRAMDLSLSLLSAEDRERFRQLAVFPENVEIPLSFLERLWNSSTWSTDHLCGRLAELLLFLRYDRSGGTIRLHDLLHSYLVHQQGEKLPELHRHLLEVFRPSSGRWEDLPPSETYLWNHLAFHLDGAGARDRLRFLLMDFDFIKAKVEATGVEALLADYRLLRSDDSEILPIHEALERSAHILAEDRTQLARVLQEVGIVPQTQRAPAVASAPSPQVLAGEDDAFDPLLLSFYLVLAGYATDPNVLLHPDRDTIRSLAESVESDGGEVRPRLHEIQRELALRCGGASPNPFWLAWMRATKREILETWEEQPLS